MENALWMLLEQCCSTEGEGGKVKKTVSGKRIRMIVLEQCCSTGGGGGEVKKRNDFAKIKVENALWMLLEQCCSTGGEGGKVKKQ